MSTFLMLSQDTRHSGKGLKQSLAVTPIQWFMPCALTSLSFTNVNLPRTSPTGHDPRLS